MVSNPGPRASVELARQARLDARSGKLTGPTANLAPGHVQANLAILPRALAADFLHFCQRNPKPCPLLAMSEPGDPALPELGQDIDIRSDIRATASGRTANWWPNPPTCATSGATTWCLS